jgi:uncharacterized protein
VPFEFDPLKSAANKAKHGIDFLEAQALWSDPDRIELQARPMNEARFLIVGQIREAVWTATVTYRHEEAIRIRIISVRRARDDEKARYIDTPARRR